MRGHEGDEGEREALQCSTARRVLGERADVYCDDSSFVAGRKGVRARTLQTAPLYWTWGLYVAVVQGALRPWPSARKPPCAGRMHCTGGRAVTSLSAPSGCCPSRAGRSAPRQQRQ